MTMGKLFDKLLNRKKERHPRCAALVPAAGRSERMGGTDKLTAPLCGVPVLLRTLRALDEAALIDEIVVAVSPERLEEIAALCAGANVKTPLRVVAGAALSRCCWRRWRPATAASCWRCMTARGR